MARNLHVGVDLGSTSIKVVGMQQRRDGYHLLFHEVVDLVNDDFCEAFDDITDGVYVTQLRRIARKYGLGRATVSAAVPTSSAILRDITVVTPESEDALAENIQEELRQVTDMNLDEMRIACEVMDEGNHNATAVSLFACAVPERAVRRVQHILQGAGLSPQVLAPDALEIYNAFDYFTRNAEAAPLSLVHIGSQYTVCILTQPGKSPFFYIIRLGGNDITKRLMQELRLSFKKAEILKRKIYQAKWVRSAAYGQSHLHDIFAEFADLLIAEVKKCIRHYQANEGVSFIEKVFLTGGGAKLCDLAQSFQLQLDIPTRLWDPVEALASVAQPSGAEPGVTDGVYFGACIGAVVRGEER